MPQSGICASSRTEGKQLQFEGPIASLRQNQFVVDVGACRPVGSAHVVGDKKAGLEPQ